MAHCLEENMQVKTSLMGSSALTTRAKANPAAKVEVSEGPAESFTFSGSEKTPTAVKVGKYALAAVATAGAGALGYFAGNNLGTAATVAGVVGGAAAGVCIGGTVGLMADLGGGFLGNSNHTATAAVVGGVLGAAAGGAMGGMVESGIGGAIMAVATGGSALAATSMATNILAD